MPDKPRIAIVGAGPGGTTAALYLQRYGYDISVFEASARIERVGAGIGLSPNCTRVFADLGLLERMAEVGVTPRQRLFRHGYSGELTSSLPVLDYPKQFGAPNIIMHRGDLQEIMTAAVAPGTIRLGKRLLDIIETSTALRMVFTDGTTAEADIVIGADGINSRIRELLLGPEKPVYGGEVAYRSIYPVEQLGDLELADHTKWWTDSTYIMIYFITHAHDVIYFVTGVKEPDWGSDVYTPRPAEMRKLRDAFAGFHPEVLRVIDAAPSATAWPIIDRDPLPLWSHGNIVLLGDACHPMQPHMGQGAAMAVEDGAMLSRCIEHYRGQDPQEIFRLYEELRRERTSLVQSGSRTDDFLRTGVGKAEWVYRYNVLTVPLERDNAALESPLL